VEPKTALAHQIKTGKTKNIDEQQGAEHFEIMLEEMKKNNFIQYEISNFCKENYYSKHNSNYWLKVNYLGLGPSAHSYNGETRQWNVANNMKYIKALELGELDFEKEELTTEQRYNEYILTSLRTMWGTDLNYIEKHFGKESASYCLAEAKQYIEQGNVILQNNILTLSDKGKLLADKIASDLFSTPPQPSPKGREV
jgi:oxygen-independent coproporphyrinogen-3 oxidase